MYTPFWRVGAGGAERKGEAKLKSQDRVVLSHGQGPSYLSRGRDVTYANGADQMTRWNIFNFLRANGKESCAGRSGCRPLEGDRGIYRRPNNCVKTP